MFWRKTSASTDDRFATLSRRLDDAESTLRTLRTEWLDTLDRLERIMGRLSKRASRAAAAEAAEPAAVEPTADGSEAARLVAIRRSRHPAPGRQ